MVGSIPRSELLKVWLDVTDDHPNDPLHGITLKAILEHLVATHGFPELAARIKIRCFMFDASVASSLKFLRRNDWARREVEQLYLDEVRS